MTIQRHRLYLTTLMLGLMGLVSFPMAVAKPQMAVASPFVFGGQEAAPATVGQSAADPPLPGATTADLKRYQELIIVIKDHLKSNNQSATQFYLNGLEASFDWRDQWQQSLTGLENDLAEFRSLACKIYVSDLEQPAALAEMIRPITADMIDRGQLLNLSGALEKLLRDEPDDVTLKRNLGLVYAKTNQFRLAMDILTTLDAEAFASITDNERGLILALPLLRQTFPQEQSIRTAEEESDDLPRVKLATTRGDIVIELFENEAPETVANFISLVESGHYDDTIFHRVIKDFMAQGGGFTETNYQKPMSYKINDEFKSTEFRRHFRGSVSMANTGKPNSGASQFFINHVATPFLDGKHTVFGRIIQGESTWQRFAKTHRLKLDEETKKSTEEPIDEVLPDKIISAKVIRKRPHVYTPVKAE